MSSRPPAGRRTLRRATALLLLGGLGAAAAPEPGVRGPGLHVAAQLELGMLELPAGPVRVEGISLSFALDPPALQPTASVSVARIHDVAKPPRFPALTAKGSLRPAPGGAAGFEGRIRDAAGHLTLDVRGQHDAATGMGGATLRLAPLELAPGRLAPKDLLPALAWPPGTIRGQVEVRAELSWRSGKLKSRAELALRDLGAELEWGRVEGVHAVIELDGPTPLSTPPDQLIAVGRVDFGLVLTDGLVRFRLRPDGKIELASAAWSFAGGRVHSAGILDPAAPEQSLTLDVESLDLASLLQLVNLDGLGGEGKLSGSLPLERRAGALTIRGGRLASVGPGRLRYTGHALPEGVAEQAGGLEVLLGALRNFEFRELALRVDGDPQGRMTLGVDLAGANPAYRGGQPVELHLNVDAELVDLLQERELATGIPREVEKRLERFTRRRSH